MADTRGVAVRMAALQGIYWCAVASVASYATAMFNAEGVSAGRIGLVVLIYTGGGFLGQFLIGALADRMRTDRGVFIAGMLLAIPLGFGVVLLREFWLRVACLGLMGVLIIPCAPVLDTWFFKGLPDAPARYGGVRATGSLAYAVYCAVYSLALEHFGYAVMPWVNLGMTAALIAVAVTVPDVDPASFSDPAERKERPGFREAAKTILRSRDLMLVYLALLFTGIGIGSLLQMLPVLLEAVGGDVSVQGLTILLACLLEAVFVLLNGKLLRVPDVALLAGGAGSGALLLLGVGAARSVFWVVTACTFRGVSYALTLLGMRRVLLRLAPPELVNTASNVGDGLYVCLGAMLGSLMSGWLLETGGAPLMGAVCAAFEAAAFLMLIPVMRKKPV